MCDVASVESTASPSAPPTCCDVLKRPDARPASSASTFVVASSVNGTNVMPMPIDMTTMLGKRLVKYVLWMSSCVR